MRKVLICLLWMLTLGLTFLLGNKVRRAEQPAPKPVEAMHEMPDLQIVESLTRAQISELVFSSLDVGKDELTVRVSDPGKESQQFKLAKRNTNFDESLNPSNNLSPGVQESKERTYVAYPCIVGHDSKGNPVWGVCLRCKF